MYHIHFPLQTSLFQRNFGIVIIGIFGIQYVPVKRKFKRPAPFAMNVSIGYVPV